MATLESLAGSGSSRGSSESGGSFSDDAHESAAHKDMPKDGLVLFTATEKLHKVLTLLSASACTLMCARSNQLRWWLLLMLAHSLGTLSVRHAASRMQNQHLARQLVATWTIVMGNLAWASYSASEAPILFNQSAFLLILGLFYFVCLGCAGVLVTTWPQRIFMTICIMAHNTYANSLVPAEMKLFSDAEAGLLVGFVAVFGFSMASMTPQLATLLMRISDAEAGERRARMEAVMLDQHVAALERARREALLKQVGGESKPRRRRTAADARPPSMEPSTLHSVSEE